MIVRTKGDIHSHAHDEMDHKGLTPNTHYAVIGVEHAYFRILDNDGLPCLYPAYLFDVIDASIPDGWVESGESIEERAVYPPEISEAFFWDRYFDGEASAIEAFSEYLKRVDRVGE